MHPGYVTPWLCAPSSAGDTTIYPPVVGGLRPSRKITAHFPRGVKIRGYLALKDACTFQNPLRPRQPLC